jgi:hypothetical protein
VSTTRFDAFVATLFAAFVDFFALSIILTSLG